MSKGKNREGLEVKGEGDGEGEREEEVTSRGKASLHHQTVNFITKDQISWFVSTITPSPPRW